MGELEPKINVWSLALRSLVVQFPILGPVLYEILTETLPNYRLERIQYLVGELDRRVASLEDGTVLRKLSEPIFADLLADGIRLAARSPGRMRQEQIAAIVVDGLTADERRAISR